MFLNARLNSGYITTGELDIVVSDCRMMANKLGLVIVWRIKGRTATAILKFNGHILWQCKYIDNNPHQIIFKMYVGLQMELLKRTKENNESIARMRQAELERIAEKKIMDMPSWQDRRKS